MSFVTKSEVEQRRVDEQYERDCATAMLEIYRAYPTLVPCEATAKRVCEICNTWAEGRVIPTPAIFEEAITENPETGLPVTSVEAQKTALIAEINVLLKSPSGDGRGGRYSDFDLQQYNRNVLRYMTRDALIERRDGIINAQRLQGMTATQIKAEEAAKRKAPLPLNTLPPEVTRAKLLADTVTP